MIVTELWRRLLFLIRRGQRLKELDEEMRLHVELRARSLEGRNADPREAATLASRQFGNRAGFAESAWDLWSFNTLESAWRDLVFGARVLRASPGFTAIAVTTLALGIGATTGMFSVIDNVMMEPFPYAHQQRLYSVAIRYPSAPQAGERTLLPADELLDYQQRNRVFEDVMGVAINRALWNSGAAPESVNAPLVTPNAFQFLGVPALLGRIAVAADAQPASPPVCVMSYSFWKDRFAGDRAIIGKTLVLDGMARTVIGVMPPRFVFWSGDVWLPTRLVRTGRTDPPWYYLLGRLKPGLRVSRADGDLQRLAEGLASSYPPNLYSNHFQIHLESFIDASTGRIGRTLYTLLAAVGLLLLIACANVANLLLARANSRKRELALRASLGAGWWRISRQLFLESALLAVPGAALGCGIAWLGLRILVAVLPPDTFPDEAVITLNGRVLLATAAVTVLTAVFFGTVPLLGGLRREVGDALKSGGYGHSGFRRTRARALLIVTEVAVSLALLSAAGLTMRTFLRERNIPLGISPNRVLTAEIFLTRGRPRVEQQARFARDFTRALQELPGVVDAAITTDIIPFGGAQGQLAVSMNTQGAGVEGQFACISPPLFHALGIPLLEGRSLNESDVDSKRMVAVVNRSLAAKLFPHRSPLGERVRVSSLALLPHPIADPWVQVVGVVADYRNNGVRQPVVPEVFLPYTITAFGGFTVVARTAGDPHALTRTLESTALRLDGSAMVRHTRTIADALEAEVYSRPRFALRIFAVFASLALLLVGAGIYSVTAWAVAQRRREFGIRIALGATAGDVRALVLGGEMRAVMIGIAAGVVLSLASMRVLASQLWGVSPHDPLTFATVIAILLMTGLAACFIPSLATTRGDPMQTLRAE